MLGGSRGMSLIEVVVSMALIGIVLSGAMFVMQAIGKGNVELTRAQAASTYSMEVRSYLKKHELTGANQGRALCMTTPLVLGSSALSQVLDEANKHKHGQPSNTSLPMRWKGNNSWVDFSDPSNTTGRYGDLAIQSTMLRNFRFHKSLTGYVISQPAELSVGILGAEQPIMSVISADIETTLAPPGNTSAQQQIIARSRVYLAVRQLNNQFQVMDCGANTLGASTAYIEVCKSLGDDFIFVFDKPSASPPSGQCYIPIYDPKKPSSGIGTATPDGTKISRVTGYTPMKAFFCEGAAAGRSSNFQFCTGEF